MGAVCPAVVGSASRAPYSSKAPLAAVTNRIFDKALSR
jgi:hypothetical protein